MADLEAYRRLRLRVGDRTARSLDEHRAIAEAVLGHDAEAAGSRARAHVRIQEDEYTELVLRSEA
ncbi:FCD domain-containing protein [Kocuria nitroreducens]|uniref:FCD domain-containing protein n=1 Tax=Kocuria nitroreducens TaxID=3058914 RepID=UPI0036D78D48